LRNVPAAKRGAFSKRGGNPPISPYGKRWTCIATTANGRGKTRYPGSEGISGGKNSAVCIGPTKKSLLYGSKRGEKKETL